MRSFIIALLVLGATACSSTPPIPLAPTPTPTCDTARYINDTIPVVRRFMDANERASETRRVALRPVIGEMQQIRSEYMALQVDSCAKAAQSSLADAMGLYIDAHLAYMSGAPDTAIAAKTAKMEEAAKGLKTATEILSTMIKEYPPVTPTP